QYAHLENGSVTVGETVTRGQQIGSVGKGDGSLCAHLHFEIRIQNFPPNDFPCGQPISYVESRYVDPMKFIDNNRLTSQHKPILSNNYVTPPSGATSTDFTYFITYVDADNDPPSSIRVHIDGNDYNMEKSNPFDNTYTDGVVYKKSGFRHSEFGPHYYCFRANDGRHDDSKFPSDGSNLNGPIVTFPVYSTPFGLQVEAYHFKNEGVINLEYAIIELLEKTPKSISSLVADILVKQINEVIKPSAVCYGMAATSILYKEYPNLKPEPKMTYEMKFEGNVKENIEKYHVSQYPRVLVWTGRKDWRQYFSSKLDDSYQKIEKSIREESKPVMLNMFSSDGNGPGGHSGVAYKIIDYGDTKEVYIYDPNKPYPPNNEASTKVIFDLANGKFIGSEYWKEWYLHSHDIVIPYSPHPSDADFVPDDFMTYVGILAQSVIASLKENNWFKLGVFSPVDVLITDQAGRRVGYVNSQIINEIPGAEVEIIDEIKTFYIPADLIYTVQTTGTDTGNFDFNVVMVKPDGSTEAISYQDVPTDVGAKTTVNINPATPDYTMSLDNDADGTPDEARAPDLQETLDTTSPDTITDLAISDSTPTSITLTWTALGDDGDSGTASSYDIRYSTSMITEENWNQADMCGGEPIPEAAGTLQEFTVSGLTPALTYYFGIKAIDEMLNSSPLSNVVSGTTPNNPPIIEAFSPVDTSPTIN
ncbi:MAG: peptidoglycan DD-metalloendopeptidase family protein, partial [Proteobacteria bacterium]|nr:peptidoglycan DD-metalloendopeptidase family protein [Pseudomonadota bacterium]